MYCRHCGAEIDDDAQFCRNCGETLDTDTGTSTTSEEVTETEDQTVTVTDTDDDSSNTFTKAVHATARLIQAVLAVVAVVLLIGGLDMNVLQFAVIGIFALVLFAIVGVVEILVVRPFT